MTGVVAQEEAAVVRDLPQLASRDEVAGVLDDRRVPVVEPHRRADAGGRSGRGDLSGLGRKPPQGLLAPEVLAGLGGGDRHLAMHEVRRGDADGIDLRVLEDLPPVGGRRRVPELLLRLARAIRALIRDDDQLGFDAEVRVVVQHALVRGQLEGVGFFIS